MALINIGHARDTSRQLTKPEQNRNYSNFLSSYLQYTQNQEATKRIHTWVAISIIAAALERKAYINAGYFKIYPNLYICIVGESGTIRKSTSTGIGVELLKAIPTCKIMSERVTAAALIQQLSEAQETYYVGTQAHRQAALFCYASELIVFMREIFGSISELLTTFYDCLGDSERPWVYGKVSEQISIYAPCLNLLGGSTPTWLARAFPADEMEGGLSSRFIYVVEKAMPDRFIAWPELNSETSQMKSRLIHDLGQINQLHGEFRKTPDAHQFYADWYVNFKKTIDSRGDPRFKGYYGRKPTTVLKLAMILSASESNSMIFTDEHISKAIDLLGDLETLMFDAFGGTGRSELAEGVTKVRAVFDVRNEITQSELMSLFWRDFSGDDISKIIRDLVSMKEIQVISTGRDIVFKKTRV